MKRIQLRRPGTFSPADYARHFRQGQESVRQAASAQDPQTHTGLPQPSTQSDTGPAPHSSQSVAVAASPSSSTPSSSSTSSTSTLPDNRCSYTSTDGRRCRMFRSSDHPDLCHHHAVRELRSLDQATLEPLAAEILGPIRDFRSAAAINAAVANMFVLLADGRLDTKRAAVLTYMAQFLNQTLKQVSWEQIDRQPSDNLRAALSAILKRAKPSHPVDKRIHAALSAAVLKSDPGNSR